MPTTIGPTTIASLRIGNTAITRAYAGTSMVFDTAVPAPTLLGLVPTSKTQAQQDASVQTLWNNWKGNLRQNTANGWYAVFANAQSGANPYVAEGQGYGMLLAAQMAPYDSGAKAIFDGLTKYVLDHPSSIDARLHAAEQDANMVSHNGSDSATDGDLDIAMAHLIADKRWGSAGTYNYLQLALNRITAIKETLISPTTGLLELGDWSSGTWANISRPSDWMIGHFEAFRQASGDTAWDTIQANHITAINRLQSVYAPSTGLLPDFTINPPATVQPAPANTLESANDGNYYYNACRTPWRLGVAASTAARTAAARMGAWAKTKSGGNPAALETGYTLDGTTVTGGTYQDLSFIAPFAVGAAAGDDQGWLNALWDYLAQNATNTDYYSGSIQLLSMIYLSRTYYVDPTAATAPPAQAAASVRSVTAASIAYNTTAKTITKPAGTASGDLLLLAIHIDYGAASAFAPPSGFTTLQTIDQGNNLSKCLIAYKVAGASEPSSYTLTIPTDADCRADMVAVKDAETTVAPAIAMTTGAASNTAHTAPTVTPKSSSGLLLCIASKDASAAGVTYSWTPPTGMAERTDATVNTYLTMTTASLAWASSSATGARQFGLAVTPTSAAATEALLTSVVIPTKGSVTTAPPPSSGYTPTPSITTTPAGPYTDRTAVSYTGAGRTSEYHINTTAATSSAPAPLVIHLHGDGYQEYTNMKNGVTTSVAYKYRDTARAHGAIFVMPRTPDTTSQTWWSQQYPTDWLVALINKLKADYLIDTKRIFLNGYSGGAEEITYFLMADHSNLFTGGGAQILGGGGAEGLSFALQPTAALKAQFPMHWNVGQNDVAGSTTPPEFSGRDSAAEGEAFYRAAGFTTQIQIIPGVDHNGSEPYGPEKLNNLMNASNTLYGLPTVGATAPPAGYQAVNSGGSGGSYADAITTSRSFTDGAGTTTNYRFWGSHVTAATKTAGVPLVIHLHGDGAYEYDNPTTWTSPQYMQVAKDIGGIGVIPKAMDMAGGYLSWWAGTRGANWVANLIVELQRIYNIDKRQVYLSGFSGGAVIIAEDIMQRHHQKLLGGGAMLLGGGQPGTMVGTPSADLLRDFPMHWHVGTLDIPGNTADGYDGKGAAEQGEAYYRARGFKTKLTYIQGDDHDASEDNGPAALRALVNTSRANYGKPSI